MRLLPILLLALVMGGCASKVPVDIRDAVPNSPGIGTVHQDPGAHVGREVRWGGSIAEVDNQADATWIEVVGRELTSGGRPESGDRSLGRFLLKVEGFLDPAVYSRGREVTARGVLAEAVTRKIGQYPYRFPVLEARALYLWPPREEPRYERYDHYPPPWYYDPWFPYRYPYYPYW